MQKVLYCSCNLSIFHEKLDNKNSCSQKHAQARATLKTDFFSQMFIGKQTNAPKSTIKTNFLLNFETQFLLNDHWDSFMLIVKIPLISNTFEFSVYCLRLEVWKMASLFDKIFSLATSAPKQGYEILS